MSDDEVWIKFSVWNPEQKLYSKVVMDGWNETLIQFDSVAQAPLIVIIISFRWKRWKAWMNEIELWELDVSWVTTASAAVRY